MSGHYYFVEKLKIVEKQLCKLNCYYGKVSHALKATLSIAEVKQRAWQEYTWMGVIILDEYFCHN